MNLLITSAGRRGYIVEYFKKVIGDDGKVYVGNSSSFSSAFSAADGCIVTPLIYDKEYIPFLLNFCESHCIDFLVSLFDVDLLILAQNKCKFAEAGTRVIVSSPEVVDRCNDKWKTYLFCQKNKLHAAKAYLDLETALSALEKKEISFPLIIKPRWGMGSLAVFTADNRAELEVLYSKCKREIEKSYLKYEAAIDWERCVIIQQKLAGSEYGIDIINDLDGNYCSNVVRKKYAMRSGETDCAAVVKSEVISNFAEKLGKLSKHIGNLDVDVFVNEDEIYLLEMNARFGGGYPFSHIAGVDLPTAIIKWLKGERVTDELIVKEYGRIIQKNITFVDLTEYTKS
ncbi:MAG: ATP-grasp domain-containing protein [Lachnospiraceae bacterium]|nr:ATP-grasp domain-containing protein [Lachnospiraceae bacterium]